MAHDPPEMRESIAVYLFLRKEFERGPVTENHLFQFVDRSFYRMDNASLLPDFRAKYFELMERSRGRSELNLKALALELYPIKNRKNLPSLQFSFRD